MAKQADVSSKVKSGEEISLKELLILIRKSYRYMILNWKIILAMGVLGGGVGLLYSIFSKPTYKASISFVLEDEKSNGLGTYSGIASQFGINLSSGNGQGLFSGDNIMEFLKSRKMIQKTLLTPITEGMPKELLIDRYIGFSKLSDKLKQNPQLNGIHFTPDTIGLYLQDSLLGVVYKTILKKNLKIEKFSKNSNIISVQVESPDEQFSKVFSEQLLFHASVYYTQSMTKKSAESVSVLSHMVDSVRGELNAAIGGVAVASQANPNANIALQSLHVPSQKRAIDVQANTAIFGELVKQLELARMTLRNEKPLIQILDEPILPLEREKMSKIKGILMGGILGSLLSICYLLGSAFIRKVIGEA